MLCKALLLSLLGTLSLLLAAAQLHHQHVADVVLPGLRLPDHFDSMADHCTIHQDDVSALGEHLNCGLAGPRQTVKIAMKHRDTHASQHPHSSDHNWRHVLLRDSLRVQGMHLKVQNFSATAPSPAPAASVQPASSVAPSPEIILPQSLQGNLESGVTLGCGEYFMDVHIGTPPRRFSLIIDTGSDLIWTQCNPCRACYEQEGPIFSPNVSSSYTGLSCMDKECKMVSVAADTGSCQADKPHSCQYSYWYGDLSNTTGNLAKETFALDLGDGKPFNLRGVVFGCGHTNVGLFRGAGGLLGLGKGPLSFPSQLQKRFGHKFSYCLVNRNSNVSVNSILIFGEDKGLLAHPDLQYTGFLQNTTVDTFYYLDIEKVSVGGQVLDIPKEAWAVDGQGRGGTIIDSGTTLTYFNRQAYSAIAKAFKERIPYPNVDSTLLNLCYDVSGLPQIEMPEFSIFFTDGAVLRPPVENYFIEVDSQPLTYCLAFLESPGSSPSLSILGNSLQQNIHVLYDLEQSRLGFAPMVCSSV